MNDYKSESFKYFNMINNHPWLSRLTRRMTGDEKEMILDFLEENLKLNKNDFETKLNRLFLDSNNKPKRWKEILEALTSINSIREMENIGSIK